MMHPKNLGALLATVGIITVAWFGPYDKLEAAQETSGKGTLTEVILTNGAEKFAIQAEVVHTPKERNQGLMYRESLPENGGMLFLWPDLPNGEMPKGSGFWMKNTPLPLAIIFIEEGEVIHIERHAKPHALDMIQPDKPDHRTTAVLEIAASHPLVQRIQHGWIVAF